MARTFTLSGVRTKARRRAGMESASAQLFITDAELNEYINDSYTELYDLLCSSGGQEYFLSTSTISVTSSTDVYALPADFYRLLGLSANVATGNPYPLRPFNFNERNAYPRGGWGASRMQYRVRGSNIQFIPYPTASITLTLYYIPACPVLTDVSVAQDGVNGWDELLSIDAAIKCLAKEESDASLLMAQKDRLIARIIANAPNRDASTPERVTDRSVEDYCFDWDWMVYP